MHGLDEPVPSRHPELPLARKSLWLWEASSPNAPCLPNTQYLQKLQELELFRYASHRIIGKNVPQNSVYGAERKGST